MEIVVGSCVLGFPFAIMETVWRISEEVSFLRVLYLSVWTLMFIALFFVVSRFLIRYVGLLSPLPASMH